MFLRKKKTWSQHINPDGSAGGNVPNSTHVGTNVTIALTAIIGPDMEIPDNTVIYAGDIVTSTGKFRFTEAEFQ